MNKIKLLMGVYNKKAISHLGARCFKSYFEFFHFAFLATLREIIESPISSFKNS